MYQHLSYYSVAAYWGGRGVLHMIKTNNYLNDVLGSGHLKNNLMLPTYSSETVFNRNQKLINFICNKLCYFQTCE